MSKQPEFNPEDLSTELPAAHRLEESPAIESSANESSANESSADKLQTIQDMGVVNGDQSTAPFEDKAPDPGNKDGIQDAELASDSVEPQPSDEIPTMRLDHFLQICGVETGGQAKRMIQGGDVLLNGVIETRRRKKLVPGDEVEIYDDVFVVAEMEDSPSDEQ